MLSAMPTRAAAQSIPVGTGVSNPAVFGGAGRHDASRDSVTFSASALGGYDTNILAADSGSATGGNIPSNDQTSSSFAGGSATLSWARPTRRVSYFGTASVDYRAYFDLTDFDVQAYATTLGFSARLTRRSSLAFGGNAAVQPFYQYGLLQIPQPGQVVTPADGAAYAPDFQGARERALRYGAYINYQYQLSQRTSFVVNAARSGFGPVGSETSSATTLSQIGSTTGGARLTHQLTKDLGVRLGYGYSQFDSLPVSADAGTEGRTQRFGLHNIDVGLDYSRSFSFDRRTRFSFGTGTNVTRSTVPEAEGGHAGGVNLAGFAMLRRDFGRTWSSSLTYNRGTTLVEGFNDFGVFDSVSASVGGLLTDRLDFGTGLQYFTGKVGSSGERLGSLGAGAQVRFAVSRHIATFLGYTYSRFEIPEDRQPEVTTGTYDPQRQGVRFGVTVWMDLIH